MRPTSTVRLKDGRRLEFAEYGHPDGEPFLFLHGFIGSHRQATFVDGYAWEHGLRIIAPNRPGIGRSDFAPRATLLEAVSDIGELADRLGIQEFGVIGLSAGAAYALACTMAMPERVRMTALVSGLGPVSAPGALRGMPLRDRLMLRMSRVVFLRPLVRLYLRTMVKALRDNPRAFLKRLSNAWPACDRSMLKRDDLREMFIEDLQDMYRRKDADAIIAHELGLYGNWGFALEDLPKDCRVMLWHGNDDTIISPHMTRHVMRRLNNCSADFLPGGHFMIVDNIEPIALRLKAAIA